MCQNFSIRPPSSSSGQSFFFGRFSERRVDSLEARRAPSAPGSDILRGSFAREAQRTSDRPLYLTNSFGASTCIRRQPGASAAAGCAGVTLNVNFLKPIFYFNGLTKERSSFGNDAAPLRNRPRFGHQIKRLNI